MKRIHLSNELDIPILLHIWKFKIASTQAIRHFLFKDSSLYAIYRRLYRMEKSKYVEVNFAKRGKHQFWTLTKLGYEAIEDLLPQLKEKGFKSESPMHDLIASAIHVADHDYCKTNNIRIFTEQELRRIDTNFYPENIPRTDRHRPDGYWITGSSKEPKLIALELELSQKINDSYESTGDFYSDYPQIDSVLWVVIRKGMISGMQKHLDIGSNQADSCHNFIILSDFMMHGWQTKISYGKDKGKTIYQLLGKHEENFRQTFSYKYILDTRKYPRNSTVCLSQDIKIYSNSALYKTRTEKSHD